MKNIQLPQITREQLINSQILVWDNEDKEYLYEVLEKINLFKLPVCAYSFYNSGYFIHITKDYYKQRGERYYLQNLGEDLVIYECNGLAKDIPFYVYKDGKLTKVCLESFDIPSFIKHRGKEDDLEFSKIMYRNFSQEYPIQEQEEEVNISELLLLAPSIYKK